MELNHNPKISVIVNRDILCWMKQNAKKNNERDNRKSTRCTMLFVKNGTNSNYLESVWHGRFSELITPNQLMKLFKGKIRSAAAFNVKNKFFVFMPPRQMNTYFDIVLLVAHIHHQEINKMYLNVYFFWSVFISSITIFSDNLNHCLV